MSIIINYGTSTQVAHQPNTVVEFIGRPGKDFDYAVMAAYMTRDEALGRFVLDEAAISLNSQQIQLRVTQTQFDLQNNRLGVAETLITQNAFAISLRASQTSVDALSGRLTTAETTITQTAQSITLKANISTVDALTGRVTATEASIVVNAGQIALRATQTTVDALGARVGTAETAITQNAQQIQLKASQTSVDALSGRITNTEASITILNNQITTKVSSTVTDALGARISSAETRITQTETTISSMATQTTIDAINNRISTAESLITQNANAISSKVSYTVTDALGARVSTAESLITQNQNAINLRVTNDVFNALGARVGSNESSINILNNQITTKVSTTTVDALTGRVGTAETLITQQGALISSKVSATDYNGNTIVSMINQSPESIKIFAKNIQLDGMVTANSLESGGIKINVNNGDLEIYHDNQILGMRAGTDPSGRVVLQGFNNAGEKIWDIDTFTMNGGVQYVQNVPDKNVAIEATRIQAYAGTPPTAQEQLTMSQTIKGMFQYTAIPGGTSTHPMQNVKIDQRAYADITKFVAGVPATNAAYNGYHQGGMLDPWIADGWYVLDGNKGSKYAAADWTGSESQKISVAILGIVNGQQIAAWTLDINVV